MGGSICEEYKGFVRKMWRFFVRKEPAVVFHRECAHEVSSKACINSGPQCVQFEGFTPNSSTEIQGIKQQVESKREA